MPDLPTLAWKHRSVLPILARTPALSFTCTIPSPLVFGLSSVGCAARAQSAYCDFLRTTLRRVEAMRAKLAEKHIKATAGLADSSIKQEMQAWDPYDQKRNAPPRPPPSGLS